MKRDFIYVFELERQPFRDMSKGFDCGLARNDVEHMICGDSSLRKMDAEVNYGFVLMEELYSKEISYQDPVRIAQMKWISDVRNKCSTIECLRTAYAARVKYIKSKVDMTYPSYPQEDEN